MGGGEVHKPHDRGHFFFFNLGTVVSFYVFFLTTGTHRAPGMIPQRAGFGVQGVGASYHTQQSEHGFDSICNGVSELGKQPSAGHTHREKEHGDFWARRCQERNPAGYARGWLGLVWLGTGSGKTLPNAGGFFII